MLTSNSLTYWVTKAQKLWWISCNPTYQVIAVQEFLSISYSPFYGISKAEQFSSNFLNSIQKKVVAICITVSHTKQKIKNNVIDAVAVYLAIFIKKYLYKINQILEYVGNDQSNACRWEIHNSLYRIY